MASASSAKVLLGDGEELAVSGIAASLPKSDLILLKVATDQAKFLRIANTVPRTGAKVFAVGSPKGLTNTISEGIISGQRKLPKRLSLLQTTAPISSGSSGGALLTVKGEVVGVTTGAWRGGQNLNFAVPCDYAKRLLADARKPTPVSSELLPEVELPGATREVDFSSFEALLLTVPREILPMKVSPDGKRILSLEWTSLRRKTFSIWAKEQCVGKRIVIRIEDPKLRLQLPRSRPGHTQLNFRVTSDSFPVPEMYEIHAKLNASSAAQLATVASGKTVLLEGQIGNLRLGQNQWRAPPVEDPARIVVSIDFSEAVIAPFRPTPAAKPHKIGTPTSRPTARPPPPTPEDQAQRQLALAKMYLQNGVPRKARELLARIFSGYPNTRAATEAKKLLEKLDTLDQSGAP